MEKSRGSASRHSAGVWQSAGVWLSGACTGGTEDTGYEQDATCTCGELCAEDHLNADCPVCGKDRADLNQCKGKEQTESEEEQTESEEDDAINGIKDDTAIIITAWEWIERKKSLIRKQE